MNVDFKRLAEPFPPEEIEWRIGQAGIGKQGPWAKVLAYLTSRAVMNRLDEVCGPENWKDEYAKGPDGGVLCGLSIRVAGEWITKWDGAENTQVESVKGGLSDAIKRAAVKWGLGRYLYRLEEGWAQIASDDDKDAFRGTAKDQAGKPVYFRWYPPRLPDFALPADRQRRPEPIQQPTPVKQSAPLNGRPKDEVNRTNWSDDFAGFTEWVGSIVPSRFPTLSEAWSEVYKAARLLGMSRVDVRECKEKAKLQSIKDAVAPEPKKRVGAA
jgi:hypothetical protein